MADYEYVYVAYRKSQPDWVKIGWTRNYRARLTTTCLEPLLVIATPWGEATRLEKKLHEHFDHLRGPGEWFRFNHQIDDFVESVKAKELNVGKVVNA